MNRRMFFQRAAVAVLAVPFLGLFGGTAAARPQNELLPGLTKALRKFGRQQRKAARKAAK